MARILVADDQEMMRDSLCATLARDGHEVVAATDGAVAVSKLQEARFDLMITDLRKPGPNGVGTVVEGCDVHSWVYSKGDPNHVIHREHNSYEPENGVYGSHMM